MTTISGTKAICANHRGCLECVPSNKEYIKALLTKVGQAYNEPDATTIWTEGIEIWFNTEGMFLGMVRG
jgi:hypothetical protein